MKQMVFFVRITLFVLEWHKKEIFWLDFFCNFSYKEASVKSQFLTYCDSVPFVTLLHRRHDGILLSYLAAQ